MALFPFWLLMVHIDAECVTFLLCLGQKALHILNQSCQSSVLDIWLQFERNLTRLRFSYQCALRAHSVWSSCWGECIVFWARLSRFPTHRIEWGMSCISVFLVQTQWTISRHSWIAHLTFLLIDNLLDQSFAALQLKTSLGNFPVFVRSICNHGNFGGLVWRNSIQIDQLLFKFSFARHKCFILKFKCFSLNRFMTCERFWV